jgi:ketosteroid isomerase-like protein
LGGSGKMGRHAALHGWGAAAGPAKIGGLPLGAAETGCARAPSRAKMPTVTMKGTSMSEDLAARLERVEARFAIDELVTRYALAVDGRDIAGLGDLFVEDVDCGKMGRGREAIRTFYETILSACYRTIHFVGGRLVEFSDADHATGKVYCRAEHEVGDDWVLALILYDDTYLRTADGWKFVKRRPLTWYSADVRARPGPHDFAVWPKGGKIALPGEFPTWASYWERQSTVPQLTSRP